MQMKTSWAETYPSHGALESVYIREVFYLVNELSKRLDSQHVPASPQSAAHVSSILQVNAKAPGSLRSLRSTVKIGHLHEMNQDQVALKSLESPLVLYKALAVETANAADVKKPNCANFFHASCRGSKATSPQIT
ncbi:hypothetical protein J3F83DRAFT_732206 [Trichoderma novae-zelandiae]